MNIIFLIRKKKYMLRIFVERFLIRMIDTNYR